MQPELLSFKYLWDGSAPQWALLNVEPEGEARYLIVNTDSKSVKLIENNQLFREVIDEMLEAKVRMVSRGNGF